MFSTTGGVFCSVWQQAVWLRSMAGTEAVAVWKRRRRARLCSDLGVYKVLQLRLAAL